MHLYLLYLPGEKPVTFLQAQHTVPELPEPADEKLQVESKRSPKAAHAGSWPEEEIIHSPRYEDVLHQQEAKLTCFLELSRAF